MTYILIYLNIGALLYCLTLAFNAKRLIPVWQDALISTFLWLPIILLGFISGLRKGLKRS
jgi:hypothetical protein